MITSIVFDLDGTLVDTIADIAASVDRALSVRNYSLPAPESYPAMVGWGIRRLVYLALPETDRDEAVVDAVAADALRFYAEVPVLHSRPYPGIPDLVADLRRRGLTLAVLTNKPDPVARLVVARLFSDHPFAVVRGDLPGAPRKPDAALTRSVLAELGAEPARTLFVGDSVVDVQTAHGVGSRVIGVSWGFRGPEELVAAGADHLVDRADQVVRIIDGC